MTTEVPTIGAISFTLGRVLCVTLEFIPFLYVEVPRISCRLHLNSVVEVGSLRAPR